MFLAMAGCSSDLTTTSSLPIGSTPTGATSPLLQASPSASQSIAPSPITRPQTIGDLADDIDAADIRSHLEALQRIADANGGNRATGTSGFDASVEYVAERLATAGYDVQPHAFSAGQHSSVNLVAERTGTDTEGVMVGAHLDSVQAGPGINDNASGVATLLVLAERLAGLPAPQRTIRFAFWGAEEGGRFGSQAYVDALDAPGRALIAAYLNLDILGSPNFARFVYDEPSAAAGSREITALFAEYFERRGLAWEPIDLTGDSDHAPFSAAGIPTGGLFSGGTEPKTDAHAAAFGGTAGLPADACIHQACDTIANVSDASIDHMADAIAEVLATLAN